GTHKQWLRDKALVALQKGWLEMVGIVFSTGIAAGHFRGDLDPDEFAHDLYAIMLGFHHAERLMRDPRAEARAHGAFERLLSTTRRRRRTA
ncbi:MAG: TetR/AcrR family transcriptional regulator, partial [Acidobacteriota bacterium]